MTQRAMVIDVSHWQGNIDFNAVAANGIHGVIHKCTEDLSVDPMYDARRV